MIQPQGGGGAANTPVSILPYVFYYLQSLGSRDYTHDKSYDHALLEHPQQTNLDKHETAQSLLDYKESSNITATSESEEITNYEFIQLEKRKAGTVINGTTEIGLQLRIRGDGTYTTTLDKVRVNLFKRTTGGVDTALITDKEYDFDTGPTHSADSWDDMIGIKIHEDITKTTLDVDDRLVLRIEVFAHVSNASATDNKVRLMFSRGSAESYLYLPVEEK